MQVQRYSRQIAMPEIGLAGQQKLAKATVLVIGAGGLGCPVLTYLAAAGIGHIHIVDADHVALHNLHRQTLFTEADIGKNKAQTAAARLEAMNSEINISAWPEFLTPLNALNLVEKADVVVDCTDSFAARYLINDACVLAAKPFVYGALHRTEGQVAVFNLHEESAIYRCLFPEPPPPGEVPNCAEAGIIGVLAGITGMYQACEVIKIITGMGEVLDSQLLLINMASVTHRIIGLRKKSDKTAIGLLADYEAYCGTKPLIVSESMEAIELSQFLQKGMPCYLLDVREHYETAICQIAGSIHIPMGQVSARAAEIPRDRPVVVYCHHGVRSASVIRYLKSLPDHWPPLINLSGGIHAWALEVEPGMALY